MNRATAVRLLSLTLLTAGCQSQPADKTPARPAVYAPTPDIGAMNWQPLPDEEYFLGTYSAAHKPRIAIYVNPTLDGKLISRPQDNDSSLRYLNPGEYDEAMANLFDYTALQASLAVQISCGGLVRIIPPEFLADHMTNQDQQDLVQGNSKVLVDLAGRTGADVLIQIQARPTGQTSEGLDLLVEAVALDTHSGKSLGHAVLALSLPVTENQLKEYSHHLAAKLMSDIADHWARQAGSNPLPPNG